MQYCWWCEINSSVAELILVTQLAALQIIELLLVNSDSFNSVQFCELTIVILVTNLSVGRTDRSTEHISICAPFAEVTARGRELLAVLRVSMGASFSPSDIH